MIWSCSVARSLSNAFNLKCWILRTRSSGGLPVDIFKGACSVNVAANAKVRHDV